MENISTEEFLNCYCNSNFNHVILDVRNLEEYQKYHLINSVLIPVDDIYYRINELNPQNCIYIICERGNRSLRVALILTELGFKKVYNIVGGFKQMLSM